MQAPSNRRRLAPRYTNNEAAEAEAQMGQYLDALDELEGLDLDELERLLAIEGRNGRRIEL